MDMKKILQAIDGASTQKPVEGSNDMKRFLRAVTEADVNQPPAAKPAAPKFYITQTSYDSLNEPPDFSVTDLQRGVVVASFDSEEQARAYVTQKDPAGAAGTELHQAQSKATAPEANPDAAPQAVAEVSMKKLLSVVVEGKGSNNRLTQAEQIAIQTYTKEPQKVVSSEKRGLFKEFYEKYEKALNEELQEEVQEEFTVEDIIAMVREGLSNEEIAAELGLNLQEGKIKGVDGKACWKGYKRMGTKQKGGKTVDNCVPVKGSK